MLVDAECLRIDAVAGARWGCLVLLCVFIVWLAVLVFAWWRAVCWLFVLLWYAVLVF